MLVSIAGIIAALVVAPSTNGRMPPWLANGGALDNYFILQAPPDLVTDTGDHSPERQQIKMLDALYGVISTTPLFRTSPRGWRDPALAASLGLDHMWIVEFDRSRSDLDTIIDKFKAVHGVERAWRDGHVDHCNTPNDTLWTSQWNLQKGKLDCESVWDGVTKEDVLVAVVDSGADLTHKDLKRNLWVNPGEIAGNGKDDDGNGYVDDVNGWDFWNGDATPTDDNGHGSHVAGIIGAEGDDARDVAGICWQATIQVVKVLDKNGTGTWASIAQGLTYAADNGALVVNMSVGGENGDPGLESAVAYAAGLDVVQVAAAGNKASTTPFYPAAYDGVIAVIASDPNDKRPAWSNYGDWCDLMAPGDGVYSLWKNGLTNIISGTSQASPHVAGVAALIRTLNPQMDRIDVELAIETSCDDFGAAGKDSDYGWGRLNAREAVARAGMVTLQKTSMGTGDSCDIYLADASHPGDMYLLQPTLSGREPGYLLDLIFPGDTRTVPINFDWITVLSMNDPGLGIFNNFFGTLDANGLATATLSLPKGNGLSGETFYFSGITVDPNDTSTARRVMNSVGLRIQ